MANLRFRALSPILAMAWFVGLGAAQNKFTETNIQVNDKNATMANNKRDTCVPAHLNPISQADCKPYEYSGTGVCSSIIGDRLVYGNEQGRNERSRQRFWDVAKGEISDKCLPTLELVYCNQYFQRCDNTLSVIRPVDVCREACDIMVQQHCKKEFERGQQINKDWGWDIFELIDCTALPTRNGGTIPECYFPRELEENITDFSDMCTYGNGQSYRGNVSVTQSGYTCQSWSSQCPHRHYRTPHNFPELKHARNACRNPGGQAPHGPWCYTTNSSVRWEYCNISTCSPEDATLSEWSPFTNCSVSCGSGSKTRYRTCNRSRFGGKDCALLGELTEQQPCSVHNCSGTGDILDAESGRKEPKGLTFVEITIVSASGAVLFILVATVAAIVIKRHQKRTNEEEITPYATVHISGVFALQAEINGHGLQGVLDNKQNDSFFQPRPHLKERSIGKRDVQQLPYENTDLLGKSSMNPLQYMFYQPRYENEAVDNGPRDVIFIKPGYDRLTPATKRKARENVRRLPCGMFDKDGLPVYDSLNREIDLKRERQEVKITNTKKEDNVKIHTVV